MNRRAIPWDTDPPAAAGASVAWALGASILAMAAIGGVVSFALGECVWNLVVFFARA